jgi:hypothetical protein
MQSLLMQQGNGEHKPLANGCPVAAELYVVTYCT